MCTLATSGQVASITGSPRSAAACSTRLATPWAREHGHRAGRNFVQLIHEDGAARAQILDDVAIMHDLVTDIDRRAVFLQRTLDDFDGSLHTGAEAPRLSENDTKHAG